MVLGENLFGPSLNLLLGLFRSFSATPLYQAGHLAFLEGIVLDLLLLLYGIGGTFGRRHGVTLYILTVEHTGMELADHVVVEGVEARHYVLDGGALKVLVHPSLKLSLELLLVGIDGVLCVGLLNGVGGGVEHHSGVGVNRTPTTGRMVGVMLNLHQVAGTFPLTATVNGDATADLRVGLVVKVEGIFIHIQQTDGLATADPAEGLVDTGVDIQTGVHGLLKGDALVEAKGRAGTGGRPVVGEGLAGDIINIHERAVVVLVLAVVILHVLKYILGTILSDGLQHGGGVDRLGQVVRSVLLGVALGALVQGLDLTSERSECPVNYGGVVRGVHDISFPFIKPELFRFFHLYIKGLVKILTSPFQIFPFEIYWPEITRMVSLLISLQHILQSGE